MWEEKCIVWYLLIPRVSMCSDSAWLSPWWVCHVSHLSYIRALIFAWYYCCTLHCTGRLYRQHTNVTVLECVIVIPCTINYSPRTSAYYYYYHISLVLLLNIVFFLPGGPKCSRGFWHYIVLLLCTDSISVVCCYCCAHHCCSL